MSAHLLPALVTIAAVAAGPGARIARLDAGVPTFGKAETAATPHATSRERETLVVVIVETPFLLLPDAEREPLRILEAGTVLKWIAEDADWFRAEFQDFHYGRRVGYVQKRDAVAVDIEDRSAQTSRRDDAIASSTAQP